MAAAPTPTKAVRQSKANVMSGCWLLLGGRSMMSFSARSNANVSASVMAVMVLTQITCAGVMGSNCPNYIAARITKDSAKLVGKINMMALTMLS